jgi:hypothetical protein
MNAPFASRLALGALLGALLFTATGCVFRVGPVTRDPYDTCNSGDSCAGGSTCTAANTTLDPSATQGALFCTASCTSSSQCPADVDGFSSVCVSTASGGQCYRTCGASSTCPLGSVCGGPPGMTPFCVPNTGSSTTCGGSGQACCASSTCNTGFACTTSNTCTACGNVGESCCAGTTCTAAGAACGSDGLCGLGPYSGCSGTSLGASCLGGSNASGATVATTCQRPLIANPGSDGFCTATCSASAAECPTSPIAGRTSNCYILQGATQGQCFVDCAGGQTCPANTVCAMTPTSGGGQVQICIPTPSA